MSTNCIEEKISFEIFGLFIAPDVFSFAMTSGNAIYSISEQQSHNKVSSGVFDLSKS